MGKTALVVLGIIVLFVLIIGGSALGSYNTLVSKKQKGDEQLSEIDNQLTRRAELIPNLVATVKGITGQEKEVFIKIAEARSRLLSAGTTEGKLAASDQISKAAREAGLLPGGGGVLGTGGRFLSITEQYPALNSNENFKRLQDDR